MKKEHKIEIPEGYKVDSETTEHFVTNADGEHKQTRVIFKPIKTPLPKTWDEYCEISNHIKRFDIVMTNHLINNDCHSSEDWETACYMELSDDHLALYKLCLLRDHYNDGWVPNWADAYEEKYTISVFDSDLMCEQVARKSFVLAFKTKKLRDEFLSNFRDLIEQAKPLL